MALNLKEGQIVIFRNKKEKETHPDYRGQLMTPRGELLDVSLWAVTSQNGTVYLSGRIQEPYQQTQLATQAQADDFLRPTDAGEQVDDLPF